MDTKRVAWSRRLRPPDLSARTHHAARDRHPALDQKAHRQRRRVPTAGDQSPEQGPFRRVWVDVKRLRVELAGKPDDLFLVDHVRSADKLLSDAQIVEIQKSG